MAITTSPKPIGTWAASTTLSRNARKALTLNPDMAPAHVLIGNSMLRKRNAPAALQEFREYLRLAPQGEFAPGTRAAVERLEKGLQQAKPR